MFSMTKSREFCEVQTPFSFVATRHSSKDVKFYKKNSFVSITFPELQLSSKPNPTNLTKRNET